MQDQLLEALGITELELRLMAERCGAFAYKQRDLARNAEQSLAQLMSLDISKQRVKTVIVAHPELLCVPLDAWVGCE